MILKKRLINNQYLPLPGADWRVCGRARVPVQIWQASFFYSHSESASAVPATRPHRPPPSHAPHARSFPSLLRSSPPVLLSSSRLRCSPVYHSHQNPAPEFALVPAESPVSTLPEPDSSPRPAVRAVDSSAPSLPLIHGDSRGMSSDSRRSA